VDELLNETLFTSLAQAQLGWKTPSEFALICYPHRDLALRYAEGSTPAPVATTA